LLFSKIRKELGLSESRFFFFGAAPMKASTIHFFKSLNIPLHNVYGMSETTAPQFANIGETDVDLLSVGKVLKGTEGIIYNPDSNGEGEIIFRGRNRFMGYSKNEKATLETIDENGFCHSGDQGIINKKGELIITGRIKELIVTAGGENVAPYPIEVMLKDLCKIISNAVVIGDHRKYLSALITLKIDPKGQILPEAQPFFNEINKNLRTIEECIKEPKVTQFIQKCIDEVNSKAVSRAQQIRKWTLLSNEFSIDSGEFTPTMKLKRKFVSQKYVKEIEIMYADPKF
jgi:long-chain-fatty-acid--CoA ligase ACSBG